MASITVNLEGFDEIQKKLARASSRAEHLLAEKVQADTERYVPASGAPAGMYARTQVHGNMIVYPGPYARYLYNGKVMVWDGPPKKIKSKDGKMTISYYGQTKHEINKPLAIKQHHHDLAQDHWFVASMANNKEKWIRAAGKMVKDEFSRTD